MAYGEVKLIPGVNVERTPTLNEAGYFQTQFGRFKDGLFQKYGGWIAFYPTALSGVPRDMHAWDDLNGESRLAVGTTLQLSVITEGEQQVITPQTMISDMVPKFTTHLGSPVVEINDPNIANVTTYDSVYFNTPISVGGIILSGLYPISTITGVNTYEITASQNATAAVTNGGVVPVFTATNTSAVVEVDFPDHGLTATTTTMVFPIPTTGGGVTIQGAYTVNSVIDADHFTITVSNVATSTTTFAMNGGNAEIVYYIALGPPPVGAGYGLGGYGEGGYGTGVTNPSQIGTPITATDWTSDNWGQILLVCPENGGIYFWDPTGGFLTAQLVSDAPIFNSGIFVSTSAQILVAYGSSLNYADPNAPQGIGVQQDPMLVAWSDVGNFFEWRALSSTQAGNFRIPIGSRIVGGMAGAANQNLIWTDLDLWAMNYIGYPNTYGFNKIGAGAGLASSHAAMQMRGGTYWMGKSNFYNYAAGGAQVLPCSVWDFVFQNLDMNHIHNVRAMPNTPFNEAGWAFPSENSPDGENDSYVKMNITEPGAPWDYGSIRRSAWIDLGILGAPIGASPSGIIYQHETSNDAAGTALVSSFMTGFFYVSEGEEYAFVDQVLPDFKWGEYGAPETAQLQISFYTVNYPGDAPIIYGPYTITKATQFISTRFRARQMAILVQSSDMGSFWRLGKVRFRFAVSGRR